MVTNLHLIEAIQVLRTTINKLRNDQEYSEKTIGEWFSYIKQEVKEIRAENEIL
jgi:hypothetical protein